METFGSLKIVHGNICSDNRVLCASLCCGHKIFLNVHTLVYMGNHVHRLSSLGANSLDCIHAPNAHNEFYTLILSISKNLRHCKYAKTHDIIQSKFLPKPQLYVNLNFYESIQAEIDKDVSMTHTRIICYKIQMNTVNCACECILIQNSKLLKYCVVL
jgi:hypothetical protein